MNKRKALTLVIGFLCCFLLGSIALAISSANYRIDWGVIAGGGGPASSASHTMRSTIGQAAIGPSSSANFQLGAGYWYGVRVLAPLGWYNWPMFHHDPQRTGVATASGIFAVPTNLRWTFNTGAPIIASPVVAEDGTIYVASRNGTVFALGLSGNLIWRWSPWPPAAITSTPAISPPSFPSPRIYIGTSATYPDYNFFALDAGTGALIDQLSLPFGGIERSSLAVIDEGGNKLAIYAGSMLGYLYRIIDYMGLSLDWSIPLSNGSIWHAPAVGPNGVIYIGAYGGLWAINPDSSTRWTFPFPAGTYAEQPAVRVVSGSPSPIIYVGTSGGTPNAMYAVQDSSTSGTLKWAYSVTSDIMSCPAIYDLNGDGNVEIIFGSSESGKYYVYAVTDKVTPTLYWRYLTGNAPIRSSAAIALAPQPTVFIGSDDNRIYSINWDETTWGQWGVGSFTTGGAVWSSPAVAQPKTDMVGAPGWVFVGSNDGNLYAFGPASMEWYIYLPLIMKNYTGGW
jgi:hypothetical protein